MEEQNFTLPVVLGDENLGEIRPEIIALVNRGSVEIREVQHLDCSKIEADALIPALTNDSFARRLDRVLSNIKIPTASCEYEEKLWSLYNACAAAQKRLERKEDVGAHSTYDDTLVAQLEAALAPFGPPTRPGLTYVGAWHVMAANAVERLKK